MAYVEVDAGPIEYVDTGGDGPPIVLLHGVPMTPQTQWAQVLPHLRGHRVVMPTLPMGGHRRPMRPGTDLSQFGMAAILGQFLEAAALDGAGPLRRFTNITWPLLRPSAAFVATTRRT